MCSGPHQNQGWGWRRETGLSPPVKYFTDRSKAVLLLWIFYVFVLSCVCYVCARVCLYVLCGHLLGKGWPLGSRLWCLLWVCHFPTGILGQVWYLIVSIPDLCTFTYYLRRVRRIRWVYSYISKKRKFQTSTTNLPFLQDACSVPFHLCVNLLILN